MFVFQVLFIHNQAPPMKGHLRITASKLVFVFFIQILKNKQKNINSWHIQIFHIWSSTPNKNIWKTASLFNKIYFPCHYFLKSINCFYSVHILLSILSTQRTSADCMKILHHFIWGTSACLDFCKRPWTQASRCQGITTSCFVMPPVTC